MRGTFDPASAKRTYELSVPFASSLTRITRGNAVSRGLKGRASQPRNPQTKRAREPTDSAAAGAIGPIEIVNGRWPSVGRRYIDRVGFLRRPGVLVSTCVSPCGK